jgi:acyl-CoA thioester hydrolase
MKKSLSLEVRYAETDAMGVVHHSSYAIWFELARVNWLKEHGLPYDQMEREGFYVPVLELTIRYHQPAHFGETLTIETEAKAKSGAQFCFVYKILHKSQLIAEGESTHVVTTREGRPMRLPPEISAILD